MTTYLLNYIKNNTHLIGDSQHTTTLDADANMLKPCRVLEIFDGTQGPNSWIANNILVKGFTITGGYHVDDWWIGGGGILVGDPINIAMSELPSPDPRPVLDELIIMGNTSNGGSAI